MFAQSSGLPAELKAALRELRRVRAQRPERASDPLGFANWREDIAGVLETLSRLLLFEEDRTKAVGEAAQAREEAARIRAEVRREADKGSGGGL
ncbi:hypothetical protein [Actinomadura rugatobispora]|uniref:Uncharacterized protein n=1 Tax=Actinomadura rugatobispora TaxID=1994 RepID=A0ABW1A5G0_9ACTN|nr:hypothetical protein GCM10010200_041510 [Actinomadura rugatobispora]